MDSENNNTDNKTLISDYLSIEEVRKRKVFFIMDCMLCPALFKVLKQYTDETGHRFLMEHHEGFKVIKKVE